MTSPLGAGLARPARIVGAGRLAESAGEERVWESVAEILATPLGSCPLDPTFGSSLALLDPVSDAERLAWSVGQAIESCEPRVRDVRITILAGAPEGTLRLELELTLTDRRTTSRVFPFYREV